MTEAALRWSIKDAREAMKAAVSRGDTRAEGKYLDQISVFRAEIARRDGTRPVRGPRDPLWVYNDAREALENALAMGDTAGAAKYRRQMEEAAREF